MDLSSTQHRTAALVLNNRAGALLGDGGDPDTLRALLRDAEFDISENLSGGLLDRLAAARDGGADLIVVAGGDGTLACAASVLADTGVTLGVIPAGTANLLARDLAIPPGDTAAAVRVLRTGVRRSIDVGDIDGHVFLCAVMFGSPARLGRHREMGRERGNGLAGWLHFTRALLRAAQRHRAVAFDITVDGVRHRIRTPALTVTVNALDDAAGRPFGRSRLDGGTLFLYAVQHRSVIGLARLVLNVLRGRIADDPSVAVLQGREIQIDSVATAQRVLVDGEERLFATPTHIRIRPGALTVMAPHT